MTDAELIAWLRDLAAVLGKEVFKRAADRIKALIAERDREKAYAFQCAMHLDAALEQLNAAEAKLAKAVEALRACPPTSNPLIPAHEHLDRINAWWVLEARTTLAEIKGEGHE